jgi:hypothetical protein
MMPLFREVAIVEIAVNLLLAIALMAGGALITKRSIASASWAVLAGFFVIAGGLIRSVQWIFIVRVGAAWYPTTLIGIVEAVGVFGSLIAAVRALPARAA